MNYVPLAPTDHPGAASQNATSNSRTKVHSPTPTSPSTSPQLESTTHIVQGLSGQMSVPSQPPPLHPPAATSPAPSVSSRFRSPFSWLSRNTSGSDKTSSQPMPPPTQKDVSERRGTQSSTMSGNAELLLSKIDEGDDSDATSQKRNSRSSLRDRFKLLRMREEAGISLLEDASATGTASGGALAGLIGRSASVGFGIGSPISISENIEKEDGLSQPPSMERGASSPGPVPARQQTINKDLPPGTASGISSAPSVAPVDWDLWQSVVYEGPAAVARTSPEELTQAIAAGIPQAIRGVVWQVLAKSQNSNLETLYRELVARGTDKEMKAPSINGFGPFGGESSKEKDSVRSSASSIHSQQSTPSTPAILSDDDASSLHASLTAVRSRSGRDDTAKIQKLEKVIKRDLGARTSYSKYIMSAGLQDGLFGICKAYALYDEAVGYAQGMNFIAMPLLFNVSVTSSCLKLALMFC